MAYDGRIYTYPNGQKGGVPYQIWEEYKQNRALYIAAGKPTPTYHVVTNEPDGSTWDYTFKFSDPFSYTSKKQISLAAPLPEGRTGELYEAMPAQAGSPEVTEEIKAPRVSTTDPKGTGTIQATTVTTVTIPEGQAIITSGGQYGDLVGLGFLGLLALGLGVMVYNKSKSKKRSKSK